MLVEKQYFGNSTMDEQMQFGFWNAVTKLPVIFSTKCPPQYSPPASAASNQPSTGYILVTFMLNLAAQKPTMPSTVNGNCLPDADVW